MIIYDGWGILLTFLLIFILSRFLGSTWVSSITIYGYGRLLEKYYYRSSWEGESFFFKRLRLDSKYFNNTMLTMVVNPQAIYMHRIWDKDVDGILIPWTEVNLVGRFRYRNSSGLNLSIGNPQIAEIYLTKQAALRIRKYIPSHLLDVMQQ